MKKTHLGLFTFSLSLIILLALFQIFLGSLLLIYVLEISLPTALFEILREASWTFWGPEQYAILTSGPIWGFVYTAAIIAIPLGMIGFSITYLRLLFKKGNDSNLYLNIYIKILLVFIIGLQIAAGSSLIGPLTGAIGFLLIALEISERVYKSLGKTKKSKEKTMKIKKPKVKKEKTPKQIKLPNIQKPMALPQANDNLDKVLDRKLVLKKAKDKLRKKIKFSEAKTSNEYDDFFSEEKQTDLQINMSAPAINSSFEEEKQDVSEENVFNNEINENLITKQSALSLDIQNMNEQIQEEEDTFNKSKSVSEVLKVEEPEEVIEEVETQTIESNTNVISNNNIDKFILVENDSAVTEKALTNVKEESQTTSLELNKENDNTIQKLEQWGFLHQKATCLHSTIYSKNVISNNELNKIIFKYNILAKKANKIVMEQNFNKPKVLALINNEEKRRLINKNNQRRIELEEKELKIEKSYISDQSETNLNFDEIKKTVDNVVPETKNMTVFFEDSSINDNIKHEVIEEKTNDNNKQIQDEGNINMSIKKSNDNFKLEDDIIENNADEDGVIEILNKDNIFKNNRSKSDFPSSKPFRTKVKNDLIEQRDLIREINENNQLDKEVKVIYEDENEQQTFNNNVTNNETIISNNNETNISKNETTLLNKTITNVTNNETQILNNNVENNKTTTSIDENANTINTTHTINNVKESNFDFEAVLNNFGNKLLKSNGDLIEKINTKIDTVSADVNSLGGEIQSIKNNEKEIFSQHNNFEEAILDLKSNMHTISLKVEEISSIKEQLNQQSRKTNHIKRTKHVVETNHNNEKHNYENYQEQDSLILSHRIANHIAEHNVEKFTKVKTPYLKGCDICEHQKKRV